MCDIYFLVVPRKAKREHLIEDRVNNGMGLGFFIQDHA